VPVVVAGDINDSPGSPAWQALAQRQGAQRPLDDAAQLSGMAQCGGYSLAAIGPVTVGFLHDATGSWRGPLILLLAGVAFMAVIGSGAARDRYV
jgi:cyanate permease